ncbi:MAG: phenylacetate--CoA ligase family protein [Wenzhouxiangella sp.]|nr:MAG: phenylacetate--CoA ligase family protein [Wenzhouxiangella sp.]
MNVTAPPTWFEQIDVKALLADYPVDRHFIERHRSMSRDELFARQDTDFQRCLARAWQIPFYQRLWGAAGIDRGDIRGLADIDRLPVFGKAEIMESVERQPPLGDFHGWTPGQDGPGNLPLIVHTTSGTTGRPQPLVFGPRSREVQNILLARIYRMQGLCPGDVIHSVYGHGLINGGHYVREAITHYTHALFLSAGTGVETRSSRQVELMRDFRPAAIVGFADYIKKLADVARAAGIDPARDIAPRMISGHLGRESRETLSNAWGGAELFDWYGVGDTGAIAAEGPDHDGMYLMEDAQFVEVLDIDSGQPVDQGQPGDMVVTCLYKTDLYPIIRFNTHDVTEVLPGESSLGLNLRRIAGFLGRSDNMVKIRGINIFPQSLAPLLEQVEGFAGEFICIATRDESGRDELTVQIEVVEGRDGEPGLQQAFAELLRARLGVEVSPALCRPGSLAELTEIERRQKPIRLIDRRFD